MADPAFLYSRADYEAAIQNFTDGGQSAPACLSWKFPREHEQIASAWPNMSLEAKISHLAMLIGFYVRGTAGNTRHVITYGYEMLCRRQALSDR